MKEQNLYLYRIFYEVAKAGNISHAAEKLYISQSAVSKAVTRLEKSINQPLFIRKSRGVELTEEGKILFRHVSSAFKIIEKGEDELGRLQELNIGRVTIGVSSMVCHSFMLSFLSDFIVSNPYIDVGIVNHSSYYTLEMLKQGTLDFIVTYEPEDKARFQFDLITDVRYGFVASPTYIRNLQIRHHSVELDFFTQGTLLMLSKANPLRQDIDQYFWENGIDCQHVVDISDMDLLVKFVKIGAGIGYVIKNFVQQELEAGDLIEIPVPHEIPSRPLGFLYQKNREITSGMKVFINSYKELFPQ